MKTITYGFFIYIFLTTIYVISATQSSETKPKCDLPDIIKKSKYAEKCSAVSVDTKTKLPDLELGTEHVYLCTGIFETAKRICEVNVDIATMNHTTFATEIRNSEQLMKNLTLFCSTLNNVTTSMNYVKTINYTAHPNVAMLNKNLATDCKEFLCWKDRAKTTANSMCAILLWENEIITKSIITPILDAGAQAKPAASGPPKSDKAPSLPDESSSTPRKPPTATRQNTLLLNPQGKGNKKATANGNRAQEISAESAAAAVGYEQSASNGKNATKTVSQDASPNKNATNKTNQPPSLISETDDQDHSQKMQSAGGSTAKAAQQEGSLKIEDPASRDIMNPGREDNNDGNKERSDYGLEMANGNNQKKLDDIEDDEVLDNIDTPPIIGKKLDSNSADQNPDPSNHGKGAISPDGAGKAPARQENPVSKDHGLPYSGPSDPDQHFFAYFMAVSFICLVCYVGYHKKHKIMAIIFEGRKSRGGRTRRRPNTAGYRKLDCNLEEAVTSQCNSNVTHVIY